MNPRWDGAERRAAFGDEHLPALIERAAERGACLALKSVGLADADAGRDVRDLRNLIDSWRTLRTAVGQTVAKTLTVAALGLLAAGLWLWTQR